jgi:CRP-like cAMP-binding protein
MSSVHMYSKNRLLASLPSDSFERLRPHLQLVQMPLGQILHQQHVPFEHVFFPTTSAVSLVSVLKDGASAEIGLIGNEGMVGTSLLMGGGDAACQAVVQSVGEGYRLKAALLRVEFERSPEVLGLLLRYVQALMIQTSQTAVCNRHHSVDQQLCRWLLLTLDRVTTNRVSMTQELIAQMLGVRREGVTAAAGKLQEAGLIQYSRGTITVIDRNGLASRSCECYETVKFETDRLVPMPTAQRLANAEIVADI